MSEMSLTGLDPCINAELHSRSFREEFHFLIHIPRPLSMLAASNGQMSLPSHHIVWY